MSHSTLLRVTSAQMERFLSPLLRDCDRPRQRFLRESIRGILQSGSLVVTEMARSIPDRCRQLFHTSKHLCRQPRSPHWDQAALKEAYLQQAGQAKGVYVMDRGFDGLSYLNPLLDHKMRFILRLRGDRHLRLPSGVHMEAASNACYAPHHPTCSEDSKMGKLEFSHG